MRTSNSRSPCSRTDPANTGVSCGVDARAFRDDRSAWCPARPLNERVASFGGRRALLDGLDELVTSPLCRWGTRWSMADEDPTERTRRSLLQLGAGVLGLGAIGSVSGHPGTDGGKGRDSGIDGPGGEPFGLDEGNPFRRAEEVGYHSLGDVGPARTSPSTPSSGTSARSPTWRPISSSQTTVTTPSSGPRRWCPSTAARTGR